MTAHLFQIITQHCLHLLNIAIHSSVTPRETLICGNELIICAGTSNYCVLITQPSSDFADRFFLFIDNKFLSFTVKNSTKSKSEIKNAGFFGLNQILDVNFWITNKIPVFCLSANQNPFHKNLFRKLVLPDYVRF